MLFDRIYKTLDTIFELLFSIIKIAVWFLTLGLVMIYLIIRNKTEEKLRKEGKL